MNIYAREKNKYSKQPGKTSNTPKRNILKKHKKNTNFFDVFNNKGISKLSLEAQDVHYDSPTGFHITEKKDPKSKHKVF